MSPINCLELSIAAVLHRVQMGLYVSAGKRLGGRFNISTLNCNKARHNSSAFHILSSHNEFYDCKRSNV